MMAMLIDWFTVIAQVVNFLILVWLMKRYLYQPILKALDAREQRIAAELADADAKRAEALAEREEFKRKNDEFDRQRDGADEQGDQDEAAASTAGCSKTCARMRTSCAASCRTS